jgi:hypothetical protein
MTKQSTYTELMQIMQDIEIQQSRSVTYTIFNMQKIKAFFQANAIRIGMLNSFIAELTGKYAKKDEVGRPVLVIIDGTQQLEFKSEEDKTAFTTEYHEFLKKDIQLHI